VPPAAGCPHTGVEILQVDHKSTNWPIYRVAWRHLWPRKCWS